ncbi:MAG: GAP family protein [Solirubrobacterales bacterium]|nr:GAP family protein [Solirubrobacterales bacterium]MBV9717142.1 GAP family protein [Solirubrobacterales bacterium]
MLRLIALMVTIALGDSLNPSTIAPALYVASGERARLSVVEFTVAVFVVHLAAGVALALGPGRLLLSLVNQLGPTIRDLLEIAAGAAMVLAAGLLWRHRRRLSEKDLPDPNPQRKSSLLLGATIIAAELPTAFPYFAAIAAVVASGQTTAGQLLALAVYNIGFVLPLIGIIATVLLARDDAKERLARGREFVQRRWPTVLASVLLVFGLLVAIVGVGGLL